MTIQYLDVGEVFIVPHICREVFQVVGVNPPVIRPYTRLDDTKMNWRFPPDTVCMRIKPGDVDAYKRMREDVT